MLDFVVSDINNLFDVEKKNMSHVKCYCTNIRI